MRPDGRHDCPGGCGRLVPADQLACRLCWWRLPALHRRAVNRAYARRRIDPRAHLDAVKAAAAWYRAHPGGA